jgi:SAM-dependent methyltransferase
VFVRHPSAFLRHAWLELRAEERRLRSTRRELLAAGRSRQAIVDRARSAIDSQLALLERVDRQILPHIPPVARKAAPLERALSRVRHRVASRLGLGRPERPFSAGGYGFETMLEYLVADWCGTNEGERRRELLQEAVAQRVGASSAGRGAAIYVGAGLGRLASAGCDLFDAVMGVDLALPAGALLGLLRGGPLEVGTLHWRGSEDGDDLVRWRRAAIPTPLPPGFHFVVGDACALPIGDGAVDAVVSVFFTDVVPVSKLFSEVARVLRPGGCFISVGPLHYRDDAVAEQYTRAELPSVLERHGLHAEQGTDEFPLAYLAVDRSDFVTYRVFCFSARRG